MRSVLRISATRAPNPDVELTGLGCSASCSPDDRWGHRSEGNCSETLDSSKISIFRYAATGKSIAGDKIKGNVGATHNLCFSPDTEAAPMPNDYKLYC